MSTAIAFDTLAYAKKLKSVGFTEEQAEVQAETLVALMEEKLASKRDLSELEARLKRDMKEMETSLKRDMKEMETGLKLEIELLRRDVELLRRDMKEMELRLTQNLTIRLGGMLAASVVVVAALVKLL